MPRGARILAAQPRDGFPTLWALVDTDEPMRHHEFYIYGTGERTVLATPSSHVATFQMPDGMVWHLFDRNSEGRMSDMLRPSVGLLAKLGSAVGHAEELLSSAAGPRPSISVWPASQGHEFDRYALDSLLSDPEVRAWLAQMRAAAFIPEPRSGAS